MIISYKRWSVPYFPLFHKIISPVFKDYLLERLILSWIIFQFKSELKEDIIS